MNIWSKLSIFILLWLVFSVLFYGIVYLFYPDPFLNTTLSNNYGFLLTSEISTFLGTFSAIFFVTKIIDKKKPTFLNQMLDPKGIIFGIGLATLMILLIILMLSFATKIVVKFNGYNKEIFPYLALFFIVAITEEVLSTGFLFTTLYIQSNKYLALVIPSLVFSLLHSLNSNFNWIGMMNIFLFGILSCQLYLKGMNLSIPIGFHFIWNFLQGPVFGFSVSGLSTGSILKIENISGSKFSFDGFGLEGSLICTILLVFFMAGLYFINTRRIFQEKKIKDPSLNITVLEIEPL